MTNFLTTYTTVQRHNAEIPEYLRSPEAYELIGFTEKSPFKSEHATATGIIWKPVLWLSFALMSDIYAGVADTKIIADDWIVMEAFRINSKLSAATWNPMFQDVYGTGFLRLWISGLRLLWGF